MKRRLGTIMGCRVGIGEDSQSTVMPFFLASIHLASATAICCASWPL